MSYFGRLIVAGDQADVVRAAQLVLPQGLHEADRHQVVRDEDRIRPPPQQGDPAFVAGLDAEIAGQNQLRVDAPAMRQQRLFVAGQGPPRALVSRLDVLTLGPFNMPIRR